MSIVEDIVATIEGDAPVKDVRACAHWTGVLLGNLDSSHEGVEDRLRCGLSSTIVDHDSPHGSKKVEGVGELHNRTARELVRMTGADDPIAVGIGIAALNALLEVDEARCVDLNAGDWLVEHGRGRRVAVVGHFPFLEKLREVVDTLWVLEKHPAPDEHGADEATEIIPQADVVAITGTTLINRTFDFLASLWKPGSRVMMLGPSTPLSPVLFDYGIDVVSGTVVTDPLRFLTIIGHGATFQQVKKAGVVRLLTMSRTSS